ncbi:MAG TPA: hypothetical protein VN932_03455 [Rhizomicrobium sp.]|nr:hypothetical protein [Rhizomicrobium sp.]
MSANDEPAALDTALPEKPKKRDALGNFCFYLHLVMMGYIVLGWTAPWRGALIFYLFFLPAVIAQWRLNKNTCVLNNTEALIRTGKWRNPRNREEGAWLHTLVTDKTGLPITKFQLDIIMYSVMAVFWGVGFLHLRGWKV